MGMGMGAFLRRANRMDEALQTDYETFDQMAFTLLSVLRRAPEEERPALLGYFISEYFPMIKHNLRSTTPRLDEATFQRMIQPHRARVGETVRGIMAKVEFSGQETAGLILADMESYGKDEQLIILSIYLHDLILPYIPLPAGSDVQLSSEEHLAARERCFPTLMRIARASASPYPNGNFGRYTAILNLIMSHEDPAERAILFVEACRLIHQRVSWSNIIAMGVSGRCPLYDEKGEKPTTIH